MWLSTGLSSVLTFLNLGGSNPWASPSMPGAALQAPPDITSISGSTQFHLQLDLSKSLRRSLKKRQYTSYIYSGGTSTTCQIATVFTLVGDQLYADGNLITTSEGSESQPLIGCSTTSNIDSGFSVVNGILTWRHEKFVAEAAIFCISTSNAILVVFDPSSVPAGCVPINLIYTPYIQCFPTINVYINIGGSPYSPPPGGLPGPSSGSSWPGSQPASQPAPDYPGNSGGYPSGSTGGASGGSSSDYPSGNPGGSSGGSSSSPYVTGQPGAAGPAGPAGANGVDGVNGVNGENGSDGRNGVGGVNGSDGHNGTAGVNGVNGVNGSDGRNGVDGVNGSDGHNGTAGVNGVNGVNGSDGRNGTDGAQGPQGPAGTANGTTASGYVAHYGYIGCYVANPDNNFGFAPSIAQEVLTTSVDDCATYCVTQPTGQTIYFTLATNSEGASVCTCGNDLSSFNYLSVGMDFHCNTPCNFTTATTNNCGGQFGELPLVSVFGAI